MKYLRILSFPILVPLYAIFFILMSIVKTFEKLLAVTKHIPSLFVFLYTVVVGVFIYKDITIYNRIGFVGATTTESVIRIILCVIIILVGFKLGLFLCELLWKLIHLLIKGIAIGRTFMFDKPFFWIHRQFKITVFEFQKKEYGFTEYNVFPIEKMDKQKWKMVKIKNKNYFYPLAIEFSNQTA